MKLARPRLLAYLALLVNALVWGLALPFVKLGFNQGLTPTIFLFGRYFFALLFSLPIVFFLLFKTPALKKQLSLKNIKTILLLETLGTFLALFLLYEGVARTSVIEASLIAVTWPIFVTIGGLLFLKEKIQRHETTGLVLAVAGTVFLIGIPILNSHQNGTLTGNLLILGQNLAIATYYLLAKKYYQGLNKWLVTHISFWVGALLFLLLAFARNISPITQLANTLLIIDWKSFAILYMAFFGSIIGLTLYLLGQDKIEASEASLFTYLQPVFSIPAAVILLSESITINQIIAIGVIVTGVYIAEKRQKVI